MSDLPPPPPEGPIELAYETPPPTGNASMLVRLAAIFNFISAGLDVLNVILRIGSLIFLLNLPHLVAPAPPPGAPGAPHAAPFSTIRLQVIASLAEALFSLAAAGIKALAAYWLLRKRRASWALALTAGIVGCVEIWSCPCCLLNLAAGVYTIIILCLQNVRDFLRTWSPA